MTQSPPRKVGRDKSSVTVVRSRDGKLGWRALDEDGKAVRPDFGRIYGIEEDAGSHSRAYERSLKIIESVLRGVANSSKAEKIRIPMGKPMRLSVGRAPARAAAKTKLSVKRPSRRPSGTRIMVQAATAIED